MEQYRIIGWGHNYFIYKGEKQVNFIHHKSADAAREYIKQVLLPLDKEELVTERDVEL